MTRTHLLAAISSQIMALTLSPPAMAAEQIHRKFPDEITIDARQDWDKHDPEYPGDQHPKGWAKHRYTLTTWLRS